jgi:hypothetical protein
MSLTSQLVYPEGRLTYPESNKSFTHPATLEIESPLKLTIADWE